MPSKCIEKKAVYYLLASREMQIETNLKFYLPQKVVTMGNNRWWWGLEELALLVGCELTQSL